MTLPRRFRWEWWEMAAAAREQKLTTFHKLPSFLSFCSSFATLKHRKLKMYNNNNNNK